MQPLLNIKQDFPLFKNHPDLIYLDSAATSQKPQQVIDTVTNFYEKKNANIHRGIYKLAEEATQIYETTRTTVAEFIGVNKREEILFTFNTNHAINLVAQGWAKKFLKAGDIIVLSEMEHHANLVPWLQLKQENSIELFFIPVTTEGRLDYNKISDANLDLKKIKFIALTHASNVLGTVNPIEKIIAYVKQQGINAKILIDAAQSVPHFSIDVKKLQCDFLAFSSHKMLGPAGVGVLWGKEELLDDMSPALTGSNMIKTVTKEQATWADLPDKFEIGTANLEGVAGLGAAINYLKNIGMENIAAHEQMLTKYALEKLQEIPYLQLFGAKDIQNRLGIFSFAIEGVHPHDIAQILDNQNIAIRSGHHCCQVLMKNLNVPATARASLYLYNIIDDIDRLIEGIKSVKKVMRI